MWDPKVCSPALCCCMCVWSVAQSWCLLTSKNTGMTNHYKHSLHIPVSQKQGTSPNFLPSHCRGEAAGQANLGASTPLRTQWDGTEWLPKVSEHSVFMYSFIRSLIHLFNKYCLSTCSLPLLLGTENILENKTGVVSACINNGPGRKERHKIKN